jgi:hypothetical protein
MLTANDVHYIVGLLSRATHPDEVEVEMGNFVWDEATESKRDVDVTVTVRHNDGTLSAFKGVEVKAHGRKLGSETVEQLAQKLKDMPSITHRAIVSASGFTRPAMRKARKHQVELFELKEWEPARDFDHFRCETVPAARTEYGWAELTNVHLNPSEAVPQQYHEAFHNDPIVSFDAEPDIAPLRLREWLHRISKFAAKELEAKAGPQPKEGVQRIPASATVLVPNGASVLVNETKIIIREVRFTGVFERRIQLMPSEFKALVKLGESRPVAGCCVSDFGDSLIALIVTDSRRLELAVVPVSERNKRKIFQRRLTKIRSDVAIESPNQGKKNREESGSREELGSDLNI